MYVDYSQAYGNASGGSLATPENEINALWDSYQAGFAVVTNLEVNSGIVKLPATRQCWQPTALTPN